MEIERKYAKIKDKWERKEQSVQSLKKKHPQVNNKTVLTAEAIASAWKDIQIQLDSAQSRLKQSEASISDWRNYKWEGDGPLKAAKKMLGQVLAELVTNEQKQDKTSNTLRVAEYWVEAFGDRGLRSLLFDSVADFINERLMSHLEILTAGEAQVRVSALSETKGGKIKERISVGAEWGWGADNYMASSAGQDRRVDIALYCALQDLAEMRSARGFPLRVFDEAIDSIDARGREMFATWLHQQSRERSATFVITHSQEFGDLLAPDQVWRVVMDKGGSRIEVT